MANINLIKSRILTSSDYYLLQNLQSCDSVYTLQIPAFLLEFERSELLQLRFSKNKREEAAILYKEQVKARKEARAAASEAKRKAEQHQRQF